MDPASNQDPTHGDRLGYNMEDSGAIHASEFHLNPAFTQSAFQSLPGFNDYTAFDYNAHEWPSQMPSIPALPTGNEFAQAYNSNTVSHVSGTNPQSTFSTMDTMVTMDTYPTSSFPTTTTGTDVDYDLFAESSNSLDSSNWTNHNGNHSSASVFRPFHNNVGPLSSAQWVQPESHLGQYSMTEPVYARQSNTRDASDSLGGNGFQQPSNEIDRNHETRKNEIGATAGFSLADVRNRAFEQLFNVADFTPDKIKALALLTDLPSGMVQKCFAAESEARKLQLKPSPLARPENPKKKVKKEQLGRLVKDGRVIKPRREQKRRVPDQSATQRVVPQEVLDRAASFSASLNGRCSRHMTSAKLREHKEKPWDVERPYSCLFLCGETFKEQYYFRRHHQQNCPQEGWICDLDRQRETGDGTVICSFCDAINPDAVHFATQHPNKTACCHKDISTGRNGRIFFDRKHLVQHHNTVHKGIPTGLLSSPGRFDVPNNFEPQCGFCGEIFSSCVSRLDHVASIHFDEQFPMSQWQIPYVVTQEATQDDDDEDDDDDELDDGDLEEDNIYDNDQQDGDGVDGKPASDQDSGDTVLESTLGFNFDSYQTMTMINLECVGSIARHLFTLESVALTAKFKVRFMSAGRSAVFLPSDPVGSLFRLQSAVVERKKMLGEGGSGTVFKATVSGTEEVFALKTFRSSPFKSSHDDSTWINECTALSQLHHEHILKLAGVVMDEHGVSILTTPVADHNLRQVLADEPSVQDPLRIGDFGCLLAATEHMHQQNWRHGDIKPDNILRFHSGADQLSHLKIADFGLARSSNKAEAQSWTPKYAPPEAFEHRTLTLAADVFSLGCVLLEMAVWMIKGTHEEWGDEFLAIGKDTPQDDFCYHSNLPLVHRWISEMRNRAQEADLQIHSNQLEMIGQMLCKFPTHRPSLRLALKVFQPGRCCVTNVVKEVPDAISTETSMRLLHFDNSGRLSSTNFSGKTIPPYAILSHTWGDHEFLFEDLVNDTGKSKAGYEKILFCGEQADHDHLRYFWVDTCCIDKWNIPELSNAINSMFKWYRNAAKCYVFLADVSAPTADAQSQSIWEGAFRTSRWFFRGWTLQELIAPASVEFFSKERQRLGDKESLEQQLHKITRIPVQALQGDPMGDFSVKERKEWMVDRKTREEEDMAYSLIGIFGVSMVFRYGEGKERALSRLEEEIGKVNTTPFIVPFDRNARFVGRESQLAELEGKFLMDFLKLFKREKPVRATNSDTALPNPPQSQQDLEDSRPSSEHTAPVSSFPDGVKTLYNPSKATIDICFVHGLTGNRDSTWTANTQDEPWPKALLRHKLTTARILTYGYDAFIVRGSVASTNRLNDHALNLLSNLTRDRASCNASSRPLILVAHSLGGLVCKEAILRSRNNPDAHLRDIFDHTKGIAFMGTPHKGSWMVDWVKTPASALGLVKSINKRLLEILQIGNELLESNQTRFWEMVRELREGGRAFEITCFFEELPLSVIGMVVSKESATLEGYNLISIHANHMDMVRFDSAEDNGFKRLLGELIRWESQARTGGQNGFVYKMDERDRQCLEHLRTTDPRHDKSRIEASKGGQSQELPPFPSLAITTCCASSILQSSHINHESTMSRSLPEECCQHLQKLEVAANAGESIDELLGPALRCFHKSGYSFRDHFSPELVDRIDHITLPLNNVRLQIHSRWNINDIILISSFGPKDLTTYFVEELFHAAQSTAPSLTWNDFYTVIARASEDRRSGKRKAPRVSLKPLWTVNDVYCAMERLGTPLPEKTRKKREHDSTTSLSTRPTQRRQHAEASDAYIETESDHQMDIETGRGSGAASASPNESMFISPLSMRSFAHPDLPADRDAYPYFENDITTSAEAGEPMTSGEIDEYDEEEGTGQDNDGTSYNSEGLVAREGSSFADESNRLRRDSASRKDIALKTPASSKARPSPNAIGSFQSLLFLFPSMQIVWASFKSIGSVIIDHSILPSKCKGQPSGQLIIIKIESNMVLLFANAHNYGTFIYDSMQTANGEQTKRRDEAVEQARKILGTKWNDESPQQTNSHERGITLFLLCLFILASQKFHDELATYLELHRTALSYSSINEFPSQSELDKELGVPDTASVSDGVEPELAIDGPE